MHSSAHGRLGEQGSGRSQGPTDKRGLRDVTLKADMALGDGVLQADVVLGAGEHRSLAQGVQTANVSKQWSSIPKGRLVKRDDATKTDPHVQWGQFPVSPHLKISSILTKTILKAEETPETQRGLPRLKAA